MDASEKVNYFLIKLETTLFFVYMEESIINCCLFNNLFRIMQILAIKIYSTLFEHANSNHINILNLLQD
jgi:hypothetical protein